MVSRPARRRPFFQWRVAVRWRPGPLPCAGCRRSPAVPPLPERPLGPMPPTSRATGPHSCGCSFRIETPYSPPLEAAVVPDAKAIARAIRELVGGVTAVPIPITVPRLGWNMEHGTFVEWLKADGDAVRKGDIVFRLEGEKAVEEIESVRRRNAVDSRRRRRNRATASRSGRWWGTCWKWANRSYSGGLARLVRMNRQNPRRAELPARALYPPPAPAAWPPSAGHRHHDASPAPGAAGESASATFPSPATHPAFRRCAGRSRPAWWRATRRPRPVTLTSAVDASNLVNLRAAVQGGRRGAVPSLHRLPREADRDRPSAPPAARIALGGRWHPPAREHRHRRGGRYRRGAGRAGGARTCRRSDLSKVVETTRDLIRPRPPWHADRQRDARRGCFTLTNLGAFGVDAFTPIINPPECAILGEWAASSDGR